MSTELYKHDFNAWVHSQISLLTQGKVSELDIEHLVEELEDMGKSNLNELESRYVILIAHLLKWQFQSDYQGRSWLNSIDEQRVQIGRLLRKFPSLKPKIQEAVEDAYPDALKLAVKETRLDKSIFPIVCPYSNEELLDDDFLP
jgi:hypothetical protein